MQGGLGWLAGCAWTEVVTFLLPELGFHPSWWVFGLNLLVSLGLTLGVLADGAVLVKVHEPADQQEVQHRSRRLVELELLGAEGG